VNAYTPHIIHRTFLGEKTITREMERIFDDGLKVFPQFAIAVLMSERFNPKSKYAPIACLTHLASRVCYNYLALKGEERNLTAPWLIGQGACLFLLTAAVFNKVYSA